MKKYFVTAKMFLLITLLYPANIYSQTNKPVLNHAELMKQFTGVWKYDTNKDTVYTAEFKPYGNGGLEFSLRGTAHDKVWLEMKQLWGYDKKHDRIVIAGLMKDSPYIMLQAAWFTDKNKLRQIPLENASDPDKAVFTVLFEIKSPDLVLRDEVVNNKSLGAERYVRVRE
jgi:hypothetical protein